MRKNKKGFTLIEIIITLAILAIVAAFTIPSMMKFVDQSKGDALIAEARSAYLAAQMIGTKTGTTPKESDVEEYLDNTDATITITGVNGVISGVTYVKGGYTVTLTAGEKAVVTKT